MNGFFIHIVLFAWDACAHAQAQRYIGMFEIFSTGCGVRFFSCLDIMNEFLAYLRIAAKWITIFTCESCR